jgi:hypothetical protein
MPSGQAFPYPQAIRAGIAETNPTDARGPRPGGGDITLTRSIGSNWSGWRTRSGHSGAAPATQGVQSEPRNTRGLLWSIGSPFVPTVQIPPNGSTSMSSRRDPCVAA